MHAEKQDEAYQKSDHRAKPFPRPPYANIGGNLAVSWHPSESNLQARQYLRPCRACAPPAVVSLRSPCHRSAAFNSSQAGEFMDDEMRYRPGYGTIFTRVIPKYMLNEIDPAFQLLDTEQLKPDNLVVFDVGANAGIWTKALLTHSGRFVKSVHMFEPLSGNFGKIQQNKSAGLYGAHSEKLTINNMAVGDSEADLVIHTDGDVSGYASAAVQQTHMPGSTVELPHTRTLPCTTLDAYTSRNGIDRINLLKIDVEGYEMAVLQGARDLFSRGAIDAVIYEFGTHQMGRREYFKDFWEFFGDYGYASYRARGNGWPPAMVDRYQIQLEDFSTIHMLLAVKIEFKAG
jgi:FkbM family methyltransferase